MRSNFTSIVRRGDRVLSRRSAHNIMTNHGKAWLAALCAQSVENPDVPFSVLRPRWIGFGSAQTPEVPTIEVIQTPVLLAGGTDYLRVLSVPVEVGAHAFRYTEVFNADFDSDPVDIASVGLFVDADLGSGPELDPTDPLNTPAFYKSFPAQSVGGGNTLTITWEFYV